eukprot:TRINITY_DN74674_c0_g1_i1.p1 TRINITY_DN74674_c0_g1~~TRINITY_DN74674_c0_g1_i1.p1  ORF type:complete len:581 (+),score=96.95 TRINITY_DN74674_c0_g1_i1:133-1743(+)
MAYGRDASFGARGSGDAASSSSSRRPVIKEGDRVEIFGLESEAGKQLNSQEGIASKYVEEKGRWEVLLDGGERCVSVKPINLLKKRSAPPSYGSASDKKRGATGASAGSSSEGSSSAAARAMAQVAAAVGAEDSKWSRGDPARLVGLVKTPETESAKDEEKDLHTLNNSLCKLVGPVGNSQWLVEVQNKCHKIKTQNLRVCTRAEDRKWAMGKWSLTVRILLAGGIFLTMILLLETELSVQKVSALSAAAREEEPEEEEDNWSSRWPPSTTPGPRVAFLASTVPFFSLMWILATVGGCYKLHSSLRDPLVRFPQISELAVGPSSATVMYRIGFAAAAALLAAMVLLHQEMALPHLPGGRHGTLGADFTWYGLAAAGGVATQGVFVLEPGLSKQTVVHLLGAMFFFYAAWCHMGAARRLYCPGADIPPDGNDELAALAEVAAASRLLKHELVERVVEIRHSVLMRGPMAVFIVPVLAQLVERAPIDTNPAGSSSPSLRSALGLAQWLVVLNFALIFVSYGPELSVAAMLAMPSEQDT